MKPSKSDIAFSLKGLVFFGLIFLGLFNPDELMENLQLYNIEEVSISQIIKENVELAFTFKKIFLK